MSHKNTNYKYSTSSPIPIKNKFKHPVSFPVTYSPVKNKFNSPISCPTLYPNIKSEFNSPNIDVKISSILNKITEDNLESNNEDVSENDFNGKIIITIDRSNISKKLLSTVINSGITKFNIS